MATETPAPTRFRSPFQRYARLIEGVTPAMPPIDMSLGEPRHPMPEFVAPVMAGAVGEFGRYPPIRGSAAFRAAAVDWLDRRFGLAGMLDPERAVLPLNGSREGLFFAAIAATRGRAAGDRPVILIPNPYYQAYAAGAEAAGADVVAVATGEASPVPDLARLPAALLDRTVAIYVASPANPQGTVASEADWVRLIEAARARGILVFADECYSEIYREAAGPPAGVLAAARSTGSLAGVLAFNSLSKRSNLPGLRCGIAAGDPEFIARWTVLRNMAAPQVPLPIQAVAAAAFADETHVVDNRRLYDAKYRAAERILGGRLGTVTVPGGFFLWLDLAGRSGEEAALRLWREAGVRSIPGAYLALDEADGSNCAQDRLRLALVDDLATTETGLERVAATLL